MKTSRIIFLLPLCLIMNKVILSQTFDYISPKHNSTLVSLRTNIVMRSREKIEPLSLSPNEVSVLGSTSGEHAGIVKLSDDNRTILFMPITQFMPNEDVTVTVRSGIKTVDGGVFSLMHFHFRTTPLNHAIDASSAAQTDNESSNGMVNSSTTHKSPNQSASIDSLPSDFPVITVGTSSNPAPGSIFLTNKPGGSVGFYLMIVNNDGSVAKYKKVSQQANLFKMEQNGYLSWAYANGAGGWFVVDTSLTPVDTFQCGNGYHGDAHDFLLLPNGHAVMFANDQQPVDMSQIVPGGSPNAVVSGLVVQEVDASNNVVLQWRTWDYLQITDSYFDLTSQNIDLIHANGLALDTDGNILLSMRHLSSIVKINRETGDIMWTLGGKHSDFTFVNEHASNSPTFFSYQHNVGVAPNGDITLFDNGTQHSPQYSRGVEYKLDVQNKTATLVWEYRHTPDIYANAMGSVERLPGGNAIVGWGSAHGAGIPVFTEVHPDNSTALELFMASGQYSYCSLKYQWVSQIPAAKVTLEILQGNTYKFNRPNDTTGITIKFDQLNSAQYAWAIVSMYQYAPIKPTFAATAPIMVSNYFDIEGEGITSYTGEVRVNLHSYPAITNPKATIVYARAKSDSNFVPVPTGYDSTNNEFTFTTSILGDFAFGMPQTVDSAYVPVQISPKDSAFVNGEASVKVVWGTRGIVQTYHLQVATDAAFGNVITDRSGLSSTSFVLTSLNNNMTYYWRVNNTNAAGTSNWSKVERFSTASPFIKVVSPNGGEKFYLDSTYVVRWESNITDTVRIELMNRSTLASVIGDSIISGTKAFQWHVPSTLHPDSTYIVKVSIVGKTGLSDSSNSPFAISSHPTGVNSSDNSVTSYGLFQNYPNPFNPSTTIQCALPSRSHVTLTIYNTLGQQVAQLVNVVMEAGYHEVKFDASGLSSGVYFYRLQAGSFVETKKLILMK